MKRTHLTPRACRTRGAKAITWARIIEPGREGVIYRLSRRDLNGRLLFEQRAFSGVEPREYIARTIWHARIRLRETVDSVDLVLLGLVEEPA